MSKLRKMHILAGTIALICILWNSSKIIDSFDDGWKHGASLLSTLAIGGYLLGLVMTVIINFISSISKRKKPN
jgi:hypothetical protein